MKEPTDTIQDVGPLAIRAWSFAELDHGGQAIALIDADDGLKAALAAILPEARKSHRASDLGLLEVE